MNANLRKRLHRSKGQAIVEYIIIVVIVAIAALTILGIFSDRVRQMIGGAASALGAENVSDDSKTSLQHLQDVGKDDVSFSE